MGTVEPPAGEKRLPFGPESQRRSMPSRKSSLGVYTRTRDRPIRHPGMRPGLHPTRVIFAPVEFARKQRKGNYRLGQEEKQPPLRTNFDACLICSLASNFRSDAAESAVVVCSSFTSVFPVHASSLVETRHLVCWVLHAANSEKCITASHGRSKTG